MHLSVFHVLAKLLILRFHFTTRLTGVYRDDFLLTERSSYLLTDMYPFSTYMSLTFIQAYTVPWQ